MEQIKWTLNREAFDLLLASLAPDRDAAAQEYERLRRRLVKLFVWERCSEPENCADDALNRVARSLERGEAIQSLARYAVGVARMVALEARARGRKLAAVPIEAAAAPISSPESDRALGCLEGCLDALPADQRRFLLDYYRGDGRTRTGNRLRMAHEMGIEINALRNRAMRLRERVEACVRACLEDRTP